MTKIIIFSVVNKENTRIDEFYVEREDIQMWIDKTSIHKGCGLLVTAGEED